MGIDYKIICEDCEVAAKSEIHNYIHEEDYPDICKFLNYHGIQGHPIRIRDEREFWDTKKHYPECEEYDKDITETFEDQLRKEFNHFSVTVEIDGECEDITNKRALPELGGR